MTLQQIRDAPRLSDKIFDDGGNRFRLLRSVAECVEAEMREACAKKGHLTPRVLFDCSDP